MTNLRYLHGTMEQLSLWVSAQTVNQSTCLARIVQFELFRHGILWYMAFQQLSLSLHPGINVYNAYHPVVFINTLQQHHLFAFISQCRILESRLGIEI